MIQKMKKNEKVAILQIISIMGTMRQHSGAIRIK